MVDVLSPQREEHDEPIQKVSLKLDFVFRGTALRPTSEEEDTPTLQATIKQLPPHPGKDSFFLQERAFYEQYMHSIEEFEREHPPRTRAPPQKSGLTLVDNWHEKERIAKEQRRKEKERDQRKRQRHCCVIA